jgi:hypothetical protein
VSFSKKNQIEKLYKESSFWNISHLNKILTCIMVLHMIYEPHTHMLLNYKRVVLKDFLCHYVASKQYTFILFLKTVLDLYQNQTKTSIETLGVYSIMASDIIT